MRREAERPLLVGTVILVFLSIFTKSKAWSSFEALNSAHISKSQMDVRPSVQKRLRNMAFSKVSTGDSDIPSSFEMKWRPRAFSRVSTGDSDILSSCDMNDEHA